LERPAAERRTPNGERRMPLLMFRSGSAPEATDWSNCDHTRETMINIIDSQLDDSHFSVPKERPGVFFMIDFGAPQFSGSVSCGEKRKYSFIVRVEREDLPFILGPVEAEGSAETFAEALAKRTALLAIEKDLPDAFELSLSAQQIDCIPAEFENRLPDFCINGNNAWLIQEYRSSGIAGVQESLQKW
jgi:hypothetical protein